MDFQLSEVKSNIERDREFERKVADIGPQQLQVIFLKKTTASNAI